MRASKYELHKAIKKNTLDTVKLLVEQGADVNAPDTYNCTPLYLAFCENKEDIIDYLLSKGADLNYPNKINTFPDCYMNALRNGKTKWIKAFLDNGVDANLKGHEGQNALYILISSRIYNPEPHKILLEAGCDPEAKNDFGKSTVQQLQYAGVPELNELYANYSKHVIVNTDVKDGRDSYGPPELFETVEKGTAIALRQYIEKNPSAELNKRSPDGIYTALGLAILNKKKESAKVLLENGADPTIAPLAYDEKTTTLDLTKKWVDRGISKFQEILDMINAVNEKQR